ncbi:MAG TPA: hypothetical protein VOA87_12790 [Thermoanaerobaculia bacterium]|nr:hypothetical protein [Thermoanaerobaculia bacterium]
MLHWSLLARVAADSCTVENARNEPRLADLRAGAWGQLGNALRVAGRLEEAEEMMQAALGYAQSGTGDLALRARLLCQTASLLSYQRHCDSALGLLDESEGIYLEIGERHSLACTNVTRAVAYAYAGEPDRAVQVLEAIVRRIDGEEDPHLLLAARHNLMRAYIDLQQPEKALALISEMRELRRQLEEPLILLRSSWQEGMLFRILGYLEAAEAALVAARKGMIERGLIYEVVIISHDLAAVYLRQGRTAKLEETIEDTRSIVHTQRVPQEALVSLRELERVVSH